MSMVWQRIDDLLILRLRMDSNALDEFKRETVFQQKFGLLAFLTILPLPRLDAIPIDLVEMGQISAIFKVVRTSIRERKRPASFVSVPPINCRM